MKTVLKYLIPVALALVSCKKAVDTVDPEPAAVEPAAWFVEGLASADASNPTTRSWEYTDDATGSDVLKFKWAENAYAADGSARFEGYWMADGKWGYAGANGPVMNAILNDGNYPTYVDHTENGDFIHVSLPGAASSATKLLVIYSGSNINHTYWFEDPEYADVSLSAGGSAVTLSFNGQNKQTFFVPGQDNNEAIYGVAEITPNVLTAVGEEGNKAASVNFNFRHLESVFRVRMRNLSNRPLTLDRVYVTAEPDKGADEDEPFAGQIELTCSSDGVTPVASWGSSWFSATPARFLPDPKDGNEDEATVTLDVGKYFTVYMMPLANPACDISGWNFTFTAEGEGSTVGKVTVPGSAIVEATREEGESWTPLKPGYVYTVNMKIVSPYIYWQDVNGNALHFLRKGSTLTLLAPEEGEVYAGDIEIPATVTVEGLTYTVEAIHSYAFANQTGLTSVTIPSSVTEVGMAAFKGCTSLTSVSFPEYAYLSTDEMFYGCTSLTSVTLPTDGWYSMRAQMFWNCFSLASLTIPSCVSNPLGDGVFTGCTSLGGHITSASEFATVDDYGAVYTKRKKSWNSNEYEQFLSWIPENLTGEYTIDQVTARIMANATRYLALSKLTINNIVRAIDEYNFMETPNLTQLTVYWSSQYEMDRIEWGGYSSGSLPENSFHDWYFALNSDEKMSGITISIPKNLSTLYERKPFTYWAERGVSIVERTTSF